MRGLQYSRKTLTPSPHPSPCRRGSRPSPPPDRQTNSPLRRYGIHSALMPAALMIGHHFSISALWKAASASGVCCSRGGISWPRSASRCAHRRIGQGLHHRGVELGDDVLRRALGHPQPVPDRHVQARHAGLVDRRDVGRRRQPRLGRHRIGLDLAVAHLRQRVRRLVEHQVDLAGDQILHRRRRRRDRARTGSACRSCSGNRRRRHAAAPPAPTVPPTPCRGWPSARRPAPCRSFAGRLFLRDDQLRIASASSATGSKSLQHIVGQRDRSRR